MEEKEQEGNFEKQMEYIKTFYPNRELNIKGYGLVSWDIVANYKDIKGIIKNNKIRCSYCNEPLIDWICLFHIPPNINNVDLLFFCHTPHKKCCAHWGEEKIQNDKSKTNK